ncbi:MAG: hypothetical protein KF830_04735 [Planctomycetes bacterium]|nr:hypothetical protein [Planctomycetota bacterium]
MQDRHTMGTGAAALRRCGSLLIGVLLGSLGAAAGAAAQEPAAGAVPPVEAKAGPQLARVVADRTSLRCWPSTAAVPPVFEDVLTKDQVVAVGRSENGFREIQAPLGPVGYVSRKFAEADADGKVKTKGAKVAFRYRPRSSEAPVLLLDEGTEVHVIAEQEDWYRGRVAGVEAWVAESEVQLLDAPDAAALAAHEAWRQQQAAEVSARFEQIAAQKQLAAQNAADLAQVQVVEQAFAQELAKPVAEQRFEPIEQALDQVAAQLAAASAAQASVQALKKRIETQRWIAEATAVVESKPAPLPAIPAPPKDELARFQSIGWLRYERRLGGPGIYYLEKGGRRQCMVSCNTGRYDLSLFVDREIGISGPRRHPATETLSVLDAERLEVLGSPRP